jgi:hypothetical protein
VSTEKHLETWTELVAKFISLEVGELRASVVLSCNGQRFILSFPTESLEWQMLQRELSACKTGTRIALVATDEASRPLLIRKIRTMEV